MMIIGVDYNPCRSPLEETMDPDISIWRKTGHFYFALTPGYVENEGRQNCPLGTVRLHRPNPAAEAG